MDRELEREVRRRAGERCEYCHMPQAASRLRHEVDHIVAEQHHGPTVSENLALCCLRCNRRKGPNLSGIDPFTGRVTALFHPRQQKWAEHFRWWGAILIGLTDTGRATIDVLQINLPIRVEVRQTVMSSGEFAFADD